MGKKALILFARDPVAGQVKTRLGSALDAGTICDLYKCFLEDSLALVRQCSTAEGWVGVDSEPRTGFFDESRLANLRIFVQQGKDLGERMRDALSRRLDEDYENVVIIGSDSPTLPVAYIEQALNTEADVCLGPCADSGYYLIGMRNKVSEVFDGVRWGSEQVLGQTLELVRKSGASLELLPVWYDVDLIEDLRFLKTHLGLLAQSGETPAPATRGFLKNRAI